MDELRIKRIYDAADSSDGQRILVDRLWPRGVSRERAQLDDWMKEVAPTRDLRTWWNHDSDRLDEFARRYRAELDENPAVGDLLAVCRAHPVVSLLYGAKDPRVNHAAVLRDYLWQRLPAPEGDAACWLGDLCPECGAVPEGDTCWRCGTRLP